MRCGLRLCVSGGGTAALPLTFSVGRTSQELTMNTKPEAPGQWAQQQKIAEKKDAKKRAARQPQMEQSSSGDDAQPMAEPTKPHGDKIKARPAANAKPDTPEGQGGTGGP
jgi:hypothetical protein